MKASVILTVLVIISGLFQATLAANILALFPHFGFSHFKVILPILNGLIERGHNLTVVGYTENPQPHANYHELILKGENTINVFPLDLFKPGRNIGNLVQEFFILHGEGQKSCHVLFQSGYVEKVLAMHKKAPFELVLVEYFNTDCYMAVPEILDLPVVALSSCALMPWYYDRIRLPDTPSYVQSEFIGFPEVLSFQQRLFNFVQSKALSLAYRLVTNGKDNALIKKYLNVDMDVTEVSKRRTSLIMVNQHYTLSGPKPLTPQLLEIGGVHIVKEELNATHIPQEIHTFLLKTKPTEQVLFISWGSMIRFSSLNKVKLNEIIDVLKNLPLRVIWKWETHEVPIKNEKFLFVKWAPQAALLCHPKVHIFWGHGGLLGTTEGVYCGKPLLLTPIYGDQFLNSFAVQNRGVGITLNYEDVGGEKLKEALNALLNGSYNKRAQTISKLFKNRILPPLEETLWWIEHIIKEAPVATEVLRTKAVFIHWFAFNSLDSISVFLALLLVIFFVLKYLISWCCAKKTKNVDSSKKQKKKKNN